MELCRFSPDSDGDFRFNLNFQIYFRDAGVLAGEPVVGSLNNLASMVDGIISAIQQQTAKIITRP